MDTVEIILQDAKDYKKSHKRCDYHDYEMFKSRLWNIGAYGYERELANILKV